MKLTKESIVAMTLEEIRALPLPQAYKELDASLGDSSYRVFYDRLTELNPELDKIVSAARDNLMSPFGDPATFVCVVSALSPIEKVYVWSRLTSNGIDDIAFAKAVHKHMAMMILEIFTPVQPATGG
jgi:hypothetical protein